MPYFRKIMGFFSLEDPVSRSVEAPALLLVRTYGYRVRNDSRIQSLDPFRLCTPTPTQYRLVRECMRWMDYSVFGGLLQIRFTRLILMYVCNFLLYIRFYHGRSRALSMFLVDCIKTCKPVHFPLNNPHLQDENVIPDLNREKENSSQSSGDFTT